MNKHILFSIIIISTFIQLTAFAQTVKVAGRKILIDNSEYRINGICYSRGRSGVGNYTEDIALLKEANINTIRTYSPIKDSLELNAFAEAKIKIIMHLPTDDYVDYIEKYKTHPAILMWEFGNEFNYHPEWFGGDINTWYTKLEKAAQAVHELDPNHPVTSAHGEVPTKEVLSLCPSVDVWGLNLYRWDNDIPALLQFSALSTKAMYVSEAGGDSYNKKQAKENEKQQAKANKRLLKGILSQSDICAGVCLFEFCDEWWKAGNPDVQNTGGSAPFSSGVPYDGSADEEYWGIVRRDRTKKMTFDVVKNIYAKHLSSKQK